MMKICIKDDLEISSDDSGEEISAKKLFDL